MNTLIKARPSKLAPFEESLFAMETARKTLAEMRQWLAGHGATVSIMAVSKFPTSRRKRRWQAEILGQIASGLTPVGQAKAAFQNHPEPDLDTLIKLSRLFIFEHAANENPDVGKLFRAAFAALQAEQEKQPADPAQVSPHFTSVHPFSTIKSEKLL
jgi:hypothetical protein